MWRTQIKNVLSSQRLILRYERFIFYLCKAPPLRTGAGKGGSGRDEKEGRNGRGGVGPQRRGSAAAWVCCGGVDPRRRGSAAAWLALRGHHTCPSSRMTTLSGGIDSPWRALQNTKVSAENDFSPREWFFIWVRHISLCILF